MSGRRKTSLIAYRSWQKIRRCGHESAAVPKPWWIVIGGRWIGWWTWWPGSCSSVGAGMVLCWPALTAFAPSPWTGEGWDEGGAGNSVFKRLRRPLTLALSHKGRGNGVVFATHRVLLLLLP